MPIIQTWTRLDGCRQSASGAAKVHPLSHLNDNKLTSQTTDDHAGKNILDIQCDSSVNLSICAFVLYSLRRYSNNCLLMLTW